MTPYERWSLSEVRSGLEKAAADAQAVFGRLGARELNWRPDATRWSVAQCFTHLITSNQHMLQSAQKALDGPPESVWQRIPLLPSLFGKALIRSQGPVVTKRYVAPPISTPTASDIAPDVVQRFVDQHHMISGWIAALDEREAARAVMRSPFIGFVAYSVLDGLRLMIAHDHRHVEQARRVTTRPDFPSAPKAQ